jgi:hypothetical protein
MTDYVDIGPSPCNEDCECLGPNYNPDRSRVECRAFIGQIRRELGEEPAGARLRIKSNSHDFGIYLEVVCNYDDDNEDAANYAYRCEDTSGDWDTIARQELGLVSV